MLKEYEHHAQYYETDQMGCGYRAMEEAGIMSPVLEVRCQYRNMVHFDDHIRIRVNLKAYNAIRMTLEYEMRDAASGRLMASGESSHCFLNRQGRPISLKRIHPQWDEAFIRATEQLK